ncbi:MAG TPA: PaaX family transcriptional regulator C-terminal domain-containing protein [Blastocatellia bacterium]|nr:PaaX family transcriptional regulator C-terminal domain-containing protein [Blastocatellia bacterium]
MHARALLFTIYGSYIRYYGGKIEIASLIRLMGEHGFTAGAVRAAVLRVTQQGWLETRRKGDKSYYALTEKGRRRMEEAAERIYKFKREQWDGKWRLLVYNIPEKKRELRAQVRQELKWLGWGSVSNSLWITPNNIVEITTEHLRSYRINRHIEIFEAKHLAFSGVQELVRECWDWPEIEGRYEEFISLYKPRLEEAKREPISPETAFVEKTLLVHEYRKFLFIDPRLPAELSPMQIRGEEVSRLFLDYYTILHEKSLDFFEEIISASVRDLPAMASAPMAAARELSRLDLVEITAANEYIAHGNGQEARASQLPEAMPS